MKDPRCSFCGWRLSEGEPGHEPHRLPEGDPLRGRGQVCGECLAARSRRGELPDLADFMDEPLGGLVLMGEHVARQWRKEG